ncbi:hypothetical protein LTR17_027139 [Elasticomyces elasticus]|nr:hypothetical protein LTR17_027139 [Elasticomyces elasticus]
MHDTSADGTSIPMRLEDEEQVFTELLQNKKEHDSLTGYALGFLVSLRFINENYRAIRCLGITRPKKKSDPAHRCGNPLDKHILESKVISLWSITISCTSTNLWLEYYGIAPAFFCNRHLDELARRSFADHCFTLAMGFRQAHDIRSTTPQASSLGTQCHTTSVKMEYQETKCVQSSDGTAHSLDIDTALLAAAKDIAMLRGKSRTSAITCLRQATQTSLQFLATNGHTNPCPLLAGAATKIESATDDLQLCAEEKMALLGMFDMVRKNNYSQMPEGPAQARLDLDEVPTMQLLAAAWAGFIRDEKTVAADEVEQTGKKAYGDGVFQSAMAAASGGSGIIGEGEGTE